MSKELYSTIKVWNKTLKKLRLLAGIREQSMVEIIHDLVSRTYNREVKKLKGENEN